MAGRRRQVRAAARAAEAGTGEGRLPLEPGWQGHGRPKPFKESRAQLAHFHGGPGGGRAFGGSASFLARVAIQQEEAADHFLASAKGRRSRSPSRTRRRTPRHRTSAIRRVAAGRARSGFRHSAAWRHRPAALFGRALGALADRFDDQEQRTWREVPGAGQAASLAPFAAEGEGEAAARRRSGLGRARRGLGGCVMSMISSTRRLAARPTGVSLLSMGRVSA